jgi:hypothetical protein
MLEQAIALAKSGDKDGARTLLRQIVAQDPSSEHAWGWLAYCAENETERHQALEQVVAINPDNKAARRALGKLDEQTPAKPRPAPEPAPVAAESEALVEPAATASSRDRLRQFWHGASTAVRAGIAGVAVLVVAACCCFPLTAAGGLLLGDSGATPTKDAGRLLAAITDVPTIPAEPTDATAPTDTPEPSATPEPTATAIPVPTATVKPIVEPTAEPDYSQYGEDIQAVLEILIVASGNISELASMPGDDANIFLNTEWQQAMRTNALMLVDLPSLLEVIEAPELFHDVHGLLDASLQSYGQSGLAIINGIDALEVMDVETATIWFDRSAEHTLQGAATMEKATELMGESGLPTDTSEPTATASTTALGDEDIQEYLNTIADISTRQSLAMKGMSRLTTAASESPTLMLDSEWIGMMRRNSQDMIDPYGEMQDVSAPSDFVESHKQAVTAFANCAMSGEFNLKAMDALEEMDTEDADHWFLESTGYMTKCGEEMEKATGMLTDIIDELKQ